MGSASQPMLVVKFNRALLRKRKTYAEIRESYADYTPYTELSFVELKPEEQRIIRNRIIEQAKKDRVQDLWNYLYALNSIVILGLIIYWVIV